MKENENDETFLGSLNNLMVELYLDYEPTEADCWDGDDSYNE